LRDQFVLLDIVVYIQVEPFIKLLRIREDVWNKKVQQCPELVKRVLQRGTAPMDGIGFVSLLKIGVAPTRGER